jgi:hypothetical protein
MITGVGWEEAPLTPENNETHPLKITSRQHKSAMNADIEITWRDFPWQDVFFDLVILLMLSF